VTEEKAKGSTLKKLQIQSLQEAIKTLLFAVISAIVFVAVYLIPMPFIMVSLFAFGLVPALAIIAVTGAIRGPIAGLMTGYLGIVLHDLLFGTVVTFTLPALAYGLLGFIAGMPSYDFSKGRSLGKLSIIAAVGFVFTVLLVVVVGLYIEDYGTLAAIGFVLLRLLSLGLPSIILLTPLFARAWLIASTRFSHLIQSKNSA
jgi:uncharacterized membrane protein